MFEQAKARTELPTAEECFVGLQGTIAAFSTWRTAFPGSDCRIEISEEVGVSLSKTEPLTKAQSKPFFEEFFLSVVDDLDVRSSTGFGLYENYENVGQALGWNGISFDTDRMHEFKAVVWQRFDSLTGDSHADHIRIFVKPEPHKTSKLEEQRFRPISAVSLVDATVDRLLFKFLVDRFIENREGTPSMIG